MALNNPFDNKRLMYSSDIQTYEPRILRYKDFTFPYGPISISSEEDSRLAEYNYLFTDGIELSKVRGRRTIKIEGILVADQVAPFRNAAQKSNSPRLVYNGRNLNGLEYPNVSYSEAQKIRDKIEKLAHGTAGVLVTPGLGVFNTAILVRHNFIEEGDYQRQYRYSLEFVIHNQVPPATRIPKPIQPIQESLPDAEKQNVIYTIKSGDTLSAIAVRFGMTLSQIKALNPHLTDTKHKGGNLIFVGETVNIKKDTAFTEQPVGGTKKSNVRNASQIPRTAKVATYLYQKDNPTTPPVEINQNVRGIAQIVGGASNVIGAFPSAGLDPKRVITGIGMIRNGASTLTRARIASGENIEKSSSLFPAFDGIVAYGGKTKVDTKKALNINDNKLTVLS